MEGGWITKEQHEQDLTDRMMLFKVNFTRFLRLAAEEMTTIVNGDTSLVPEALAYLENEFAEILEEYSRSGQITYEVLDAGSAYSIVTIPQG